MLITTILGTTTAISLSYFTIPINWNDQIKTHIASVFYWKQEFWKRILVILLVFNLIVLLESTTVTLRHLVESNLISLDCTTIVFLSLIFLTATGLVLLPLPATIVQGQVNYSITASLPQQIRQVERYLFILTIILGGIFLISSVDLLTIFLGLELQSYSVYLLAASYKDYEPSENAGLKYFLLGALSSTFILLGFVLIYVYTGTLNLTHAFTQVNALVISTKYDSFLSDSTAFALPYLGIILTFIGISWKIAAAPMHAWSIDVYDAVPGNLTAILSLLPKIGLFSFAYKLLEQLSYLQDNIITPLVLFVIILSFSIGSVLGLRQTRIKRLLAYSSVLNVGFVLMAIVLTSLDTSTAIFYVVQYILTTLALWLCLTNLQSGEIVLNSKLQGLASTKSKVIAICLSLLILSTAGIPPMVGFFAKYNVILLSVEYGYYTLSLLAIVASLISTVYYLNIVRYVWNVSSYSLKGSISTSRTLIMHDSLNLHTAKNNMNSFSLNQGEFVLILLTILVLLYVIEQSVIATFLSL